MKKIMQCSWITAAAALGAASLVVAAASPAVSASTVSPVARSAHASVAPTLRAGRADAYPNLSSTTSPSWQTNNTVWAIAVSNGVEYVGGAFTSVRPPGDPSGTGETPRSYLAAFDAGTGALLSFDPTINGSVTALTVSPDGTRLYVGGTFTKVDGVYRGFLAAFSTSNGSLLPWNPKATGQVWRIATSPDGTAIYIGGAFGKLGGVVHRSLGAVDENGNLLPWDPIVNGTVTSVAVAPDDSRVLVGGYFSAINGVTQQAIASVDPTTGASDPWAATIEPNTSGCLADVKDIIIVGTTAYVASEGTGGGCFDGDFAANVSDGTLIWQNDCLGATQALAVIGNWLYKASHAHDCAYAPGGFPQVSNPAGGWMTHHLLDQSLVDGSLGHWTPNANQPNGSEPLGCGIMATDGTQLFIGGDFTTVNNIGQQGLARFGPLPGTVRPPRPAAPTVVSTTAGVDSVTFRAVSSPDVGTLTYSIYRDKGSTPIGTVTATSWPWALPVLRYRDSGLTPGTSHTYQVSVSDGTLSSVKSPPSASVTVSSTSPPDSYELTVLNDQPSFYWRLNETSGTEAYDSSPNGYEGVYESGTTQGQPGSIPGDPTSSSVDFNGQDGLVSSAQPVPGPNDFSVEGWFQTTTNTGGMLIGFGDQQTGSASNYDRHIYMMNDGQLVFGVWNNQTETIETPGVYNDGQWHYVVATFSSTSGMALYVDDQLIGTNANTTAQAYTGYWRVGGDNLQGWNLDPWGSNSQGTTEPNSYWFSGLIDDVAVYPYALSSSQVAAHWAANTGSH